MYFHRPPFWMRLFARGLTWRMDSKERTVYLTFDDGPTPGVTEKILEILGKNDVKATFFCLGKNAESHPLLIQRIKQEGHRIGHHSYSHLNGWKTDDQQYVEDVERAALLIPSDLFRPPYGKIKLSQRNRLKQYNIVMWSLMPGDFDAAQTADECLNVATGLTRAGDIVVFHDNLKSAEKILHVLPPYIASMKQEGFRFEVF